MLLMFITFRYKTRGLLQYKPWLVQAGIPLLCCHLWQRTLWAGRCLHQLDTHGLLARTSPWNIMSSRISFFEVSASTYKAQALCILPDHSCGNMGCNKSILIMTYFCCLGMIGTWAAEKFFAAVVVGKREGGLILFL